MIGGVSRDGRVTISTDTLGDWCTVEEKLGRHQRLIVMLVYEAGCSLVTRSVVTDAGDRVVNRGIVSRVDVAREIIEQELSRQ